MKDQRVREKKKSKTTQGNTKNGKSKMENSHRGDFLEEGEIGRKMK